MKKFFCLTLLVLVLLGVSLMSACGYNLKGKYFGNNNINWYYEFEGDTVTYSHPSGMKYRAKYSIFQQTLRIYDFDQSYGQGILFNVIDCSFYFISEDILRIDNVEFVRVP